MNFMGWQLNHYKRGVLLSYSCFLFSTLRTMCVLSIRRIFWNYMHYLWLNVDWKYWTWALKYYRAFKYAKIGFVGIEFHRVTGEILSRYFQKLVQIFKIAPGFFNNFQFHPKGNMLHTISISNLFYFSK